MSIAAAQPTIRTLMQNRRVSGREYRCNAGMHATPFVECHDDSYSLAFVRKGSFGYHVQGVRHELVTGSLLLGTPRAEYVCTHDYACGDECIAFSFSPDLLDDVGAFAAGSLPPLADILVLGAMAQAIIDEHSDIGLDEVAVELVARVRRIEARPATPIERKRAVRAAQFIESYASETLDLETIAASAGISPFHFLRAFRRVIGVTPHQYLVRTRLARAARLLVDDLPVTEIAFAVGFGDLSGFHRAFRRAAGVSPRQFRRKILQERKRSRV